jgi:metallophosphoesterase superfamily enzyme
MGNRETKMFEDGEDTAGLARRLCGLSSSRKCNSRSFDAGVAQTTSEIKLLLNCVNYHRTGWISDVHLGTKGSNAIALLDFLRENDFETLYIVGDLIDIWSLRRGVYWPQAHNDVVQKILRKARKGTRVIYIPGNHDEFL